MKTPIATSTTNIAIRAIKYVSWTGEPSSEEHFDATLNKASPGDPPAEGVA